MGPLELAARYPKRQESRSVMDEYRPEIRENSNLTSRVAPDPTVDALAPPSIAGGLISLDPTDYLTPSMLGKLAIAAKTAVGPALAGGLMALGKGNVPSKMRQSGLIAGGRGSAERIPELMPIVNHVEELAKSGVSQHEIAKISQQLLHEMGNPYSAKSAYMGPDGKSRLVFDNKDARLSDTDKLRLYYINWLRYGVDIKDLGDDTKLSDLLLHPSMYNVSEKPSLANVKYNPWIDIIDPGSLGYSPVDDAVSVGSYSAGVLPNDPSEHLLRGLIHEGTHGIQSDHGLRTGTANRLPALNAALDDARTKGSFASPRKLDVIGKVLNRVETQKQYREPSGALNKKAQDILNDLYKTNYGEWEAEASANYGGDTFPMMYERGLTW